MIQTSISRKILTSSVAAFALFCTTAATVIVANSNFGGEWKLNESKSQLGENGGRMTAKTIKIEQTAQGVSVNKLSSFNGEDRTSTDKLSFDGKETESVAFGTAKKKSTAKWSDDGKTLTVSSTTLFERDGQTMEWKTVENYKLSDDGKSLTVDVTSTSSRGTNTIKAVYDKA